MPDLLASTILLPLKPGIPRAASVAAPAAADFTALLGELVLPAGGKLQSGKGHGLAADGKILPVGEQAVAGDEEEDPAIAWLPAGLVLQPIEPAPLPDVVLVAVQTGGTEANAVTPPAGEAVAAALLPETTQPAVPVAIEAGAVPIGATEAAPAEAAPAEFAVAAEGEVARMEPLPPTPETVPDLDAQTPMRERLPRPAVTPLVTPQPIVPGTTVTQTAAQTFAAAISAAYDSPAAPTPRGADPVAVSNQAAAAEQLRTTVQAMAGADQAPLDLSRDDWAGKMVDRIAALRDAAEAADTRIRLAPENLGNVDVSIRRDGDRLHVHFAAENPATRQLLAEAAPRLAELADARGVKLGQTSVDAGAGGQQGTPDQPQSNQPVRSASATAHASETDRDDRVA
ncbi:flagellar hook-length control protein FliK [Sphingomonas sp. BT-65]|uniref:flagellar hook-length control protein FliK n=1 Tax=Sphingomonas sp. BT-65 TaxID=2989821 RepID=UPI002235E469|nr:flagellar hook-length control protein FliK [Sphingomonas sp. BT-65]MCW4462508.1 flagellar hook-length control protein FliK [Sphingomonas sp. BT-65]